MKACSKPDCEFVGQLQLLTNFNKAGKGDKLRPDCKACQKRYNKQWRAGNQGYNQAYYQANLEAQRSKNNLWRESNPEYGKDWWAQNPDKKRILHARGTAKRRQLTENMEPLPSGVWQYLTRTYGEKCLFPKCGKTQNLHIDHIKPLSKGGDNSLDNLQLLCAFHNCSKGNRSSNDYRPGRVSDE